MNLDDAQTARVRQWIDQGLKVADIQTRLADELGVRLTYMEARLLLDDLKLKPKDLPAKAPTPALGGAVDKPVGPGSSPPVGSTLLGGPASAKPAAGAAAAGRVSVSVDQVARPGALASGKVMFSDGQSAEWQMDQYGRLGVIPGKPGYKPSQADVVAFQTELESALAKLGY